MLNRKSLLEEAERRWREAIDRTPELAQAVDVQRHIVRRSVALGEVVDEATPVRLTIPRETIAERLHAGRPVIVGEWLEVDATRVGAFLAGFCTDLGRGAAGDPAGRLAQVLNEGAIDDASLVSASLGRQQEAIRVKAFQVSVSPDLLWLVAELVAAPLANRLQDELRAGLESNGTHGLDRVWTQGFCPACGSWPALVEVRDNRHCARCSFCGGAWARRPGQCLYCDTGGETLLEAAPDPSVPHRRVEMCRECGGYVKVIEVDHPTPFELIPVLDLTTTDLDLGAATHGYRRPEMKEFESVGTGGVRRRTPDPPDRTSPPYNRSMTRRARRAASDGRAALASRLLLVLLVSTSPSWAQDRVPHGRIFPPEDLGQLEGPDRAAWQQPEQVMDALGIADGARVADLGAGSGFFTVRLARRVGPNGRVYAEDIQPEMIESIERRVSREGLSNVRLVLGTPSDPKLPPDLDAVLIVSTYPEITDPVTLLRHVADALGPNGRVGIIDFRQDGGGPGPPLAERVGPEVVIDEARRAGLVLLSQEEFLTYQFLLIFGRASPAADAVVGDGTP